MMKPSRRQILRGAFGATLALPTLHSLLSPKEAKAAFTTRKHFVHFTTEHGGAWQRNMFPAEAMLQSRMTWAGQEIRSGALTAARAGGVATLSRVLRAPEGRLSPAIVGKMNVLRGIDFPFYLAHNTAGTLGNYARNDGNGTTGQSIQGRDIPTIDQLMGWSRNFYPDAPRERVLVMGEQHSYNWSNPQARSGAVVAQNGSLDSQGIFDKIYVPPTAQPVARKPVADLVLEDYKRLRNKAGLSKDDQRRLDEHIERVSELQRRLNVRVACGATPRPASSRALYEQPNFAVNPTSQEQAVQLLNDVIVTAFSCGTSRIAVVRPTTGGDNARFSTFAGDWHQQIAHPSETDQGAQETLCSSYERFFANVFLDLVNKLQVTDDGTGKPLLDASLVCWSQECGVITHNGNSVPIVTAGGAGGALKTGLYADYRNLGRTFPIGPDPLAIGIPYNQWLYTTLRTMGLEASELTLPGVAGYGLDVRETQGFAVPQHSYSAQVLAARSQLLPFVT